MKTFFRSNWLVHEFYEKGSVPEYYTLKKGPGANDDDPVPGRSAISGDQVNVVRLIPPYLSKQLSIEPGYRSLKTQLVTGYCANLEGYQSVEDYLKAKRGSKSRSKLRTYIRRLERCFPVSYKMYCGHIEEENYHFLMDKMHEFILRRFAQRGETHHALVRWDYLKPLCYTLINNGLASLFVIYNGKEPIDINLCYNRGGVLYNYIRSYDIDYSKFRLGQIDLYKMIEWCFLNNYKIFDQSYGFLPYKGRWSNEEYYFENHIFYDHKNITQILTAFGLKVGFDLKRLFRRTNFFLKFKKFTNRSAQSDFNANKDEGTAEITPISELPHPESLIPELSLGNIHEDLKKVVYEFQYLHSLHSDDIRIFRVEGSESTLFLQGKDKLLQLQKT